MSLTKAAQEASEKFPDNDVQAAMLFCQSVELTDFVGESNDRLLKVGRSLKSLLQLCEERSDALEASLQRLVQECQFLLEPSQLKVPKVRFGKTGLQMPVVTLGCMRFQQEWGPRITTLNMVGTDCQDNLVAVLERAVLVHGMTHIETARGYGSSELQLGTALQQLYVKHSDKIKREDLIIQTKVSPMASVADFRDAVEKSFTNLQVDYLDLFAFHGFNFEEQIGWVFGKEEEEQKDSQEYGKDGKSNRETCWSVIEEYVQAGKIRHVGFSTHGSTEFICKLIKKDVFDYVNLHFHYFGSYTASGGGHDGNGNLDAVKLLKEKDMGAFIISPFDKGGRLYAPAKKLRSLTLPDMEPMEFMCQWIWNHHKLGEDLPQLHTFTLGAARPSDLDQAAVAAHLFATQSDQALAKTIVVAKRLDQAKLDALGKEWLESWWKGLPKSYQCESMVEHNQIVWIYNSIKAFGLYEFGRNRYHSFENNFAKWDAKLSPEQNIADKVGKGSWGFVPGLPLTPGMDYSEELKNVPALNKLQVKEAHDFVYKWCRKEENDEEALPLWKQRITKMRRNFSQSRQMLRVPSFLQKQMQAAADETIKAEEAMEAGGEAIETEWETSYDMRPWPDFPDQPSRA